MNLRQCLPWWRVASRQRPARSTTPDWVNAGPPAQPAPPAELQLGCGWFDSSHELHSGLLVTEHPTPERVANELPLGWWLDWQASAPRASTQGLDRPC